MLKFYDSGHGQKSSRHAKKPYLNSQHARIILEIILCT